MMDKCNIWSYYHNFIIWATPNLNNKLQKNIVSFSHMLSAILLNGLFIFKSVNTILWIVISSNMYYIHDLKYQKNNDTMSIIMYYHHIFTCGLLILIYLLEPNLLAMSYIFFFIEVGNLPLYFTQIVLYSDYKETWKPYFKWCVLVECIFFIIFRCIAVLPFFRYITSFLVFSLLVLVYVGGCVWTYRLLKQTITLFF